MGVVLPQSSNSTTTKRVESDLPQLSEGSGKTLSFFCGFCKYDERQRDRQHRYVIEFVGLVHRLPLYAPRGKFVVIFRSTSANDSDTEMFRRSSSVSMGSIQEIKVNAMGC